MLTKLKLLLGISDTAKDALLNQLIAMAQDDFCAIAGIDDDAATIAKAESTILKMALVKYNSLGNEGISNQSYNGLSETYAGYDADIIKSIQRYKRCRTV